MHFRYLELSWWFSLIFSIDDAIWTGTFKVLVNYWLKTTSFEDSSRIFKIFNTLRGYRIVLDHNPPWLSSHAWSEFYRGWVGASREKEQPSRTSLNYSAGNKLRYGISCLGVRWSKKAVPRGWFRRVLRFARNEIRVEKERSDYEWSQRDSRVARALRPGCKPSLSRYDRFPAIVNVIRVK